MARKQNKSGIFSPYQWEIINFVKANQGMRYADIQRLNGWPSSTISGTILAYERATGERIGIVGTKPRKEVHEPSIMQKKIIAYLLTHMDSPLTDCAEELDVNITYVYMTACEYVPERRRVKPRKYAPKLPGCGPKHFTIINCLQCNRPFPSPDKVNIRRCDNCKTGEDYYVEPYRIML